MNRAVQVLLGLLLLSSVAAVAVTSLLADESRSAFHQDINDVFLAPQSTDVRRLGTGPMALANEPTLQGATIVVLHADTSYSTAELDALDKHVQNGGTLVILDTHSRGSSIAARHGILFERVPLDEPQGYTTVEVDGTSLKTSTRNATALLITPESDAEVLAWSTPESHLDRTGDGTIDEADPNGPFPLIARLNLGEGTIWAIATPAAFDPNAEHLLDEAALRSQAFGGASLALIDEGHIQSDDPLLQAARAAWTLATNPWRWIILPVAALALVAALLPAEIPGLRPHTFNPRILLSKLRQETSSSTRAPSGLTDRGRIALATSATLVLASVAFGSHQATWAGIFLLVPTLGAFFIRPPEATAVRSVSARRIPEATPVRVDLQIQFKGNRAGIVVQDELPGFFETEGQALLHPRRRTEELHYNVSPARLGRYQIGPLNAERSDPLGLRVQINTLVEATDVRVTPRLEDTRDAPFKTRIPQIISGGHQVNRAGGGTEFLALREYHTGDTMRMVNWKASARAKNLMVNQRVHETPLILTIIVDTRGISDHGPADSTPFVRAARSAASIVQETIAGRDRCRIIIYGNGVQKVEGRGGDVLHKFLEHMADTRAHGTTSLRHVVDQIHTELRKGQPVVYVGAGEDDDSVETALEVIRRRGSPLHVVMPMIEDLGDPETRSASRDQHKLATRLRGRGFPVYELEPNRRLEDAWRILEAPA